MSIYKSENGEAEVRQWCEARVESGPWSFRRLVQTDLGPTHVASVGTGARAVLWLPGTNFNAATTSELAAQLGTDFRFHVADLPGQPGLSGAEHPGKDRLTEYGAWVDELVDALRAEEDLPLVLAGHSLGAAVALAATPTPAIVGIALFGPAGLIRVRVTPKLLAVSLPWLVRPSFHRGAALLEYMQDGSIPIDDELARWLEMVARHTRQVGAPGPLPEATIARWRGRAVVASGKEDRFFPPERLQPVVERALDTPVEAIDGAGHLLPDERPDAVVAAVRTLFGTDDERPD